jgi:hypothetical protein
VRHARKSVFVNDARCNDGKIYDLDFNPVFELIKKKLEN